MRPVDARWEVNQPFGSYATGGVVGNEFGTEVQQLVFQYGNYQPAGHAGCDIACPIGTPVHAIAAGTVLWADWGTNLPGDDSDWGYRQRWYLYKTFPGIVTVIQHDGWKSIYAHLSEAPLNIGDVVAEGQQIALSGNTRAPGVTLGAHLHTEALVDDSYSTGNGLIYGRTDPTPYFGTIAAQGTITPMEEGFLMALTDAEQAEILAHVRQADTKADVLVQRTGDLAELVENVRKLVYALASLPAATLNQPFTLPDGTVTNLAGILSAIHAQPAPATTVTNVAADPEAVVRALAVQLNK